MCHGVFDLVHVGHLRHFKQARDFADMLVVTVTPDCYVNKGPGRPVFAENLRLEALAALEFVDYVALNRWPVATEAIRLLKPNFYVKGAEYKKAEDDLTGKIREEGEAIRAVGGRLAFTDDIVFSSSSLLNNHMRALSGPLSEFLEEFRPHVAFGQILSVFDALRPLRILVIGETIIDEYQYCETLGKSGKEPVLVARSVGMERHAGGILAIANHVAALVNQVDLLTQLGEQDSQEAFVRERLAPAVAPVFLTLKGAPTIVKRRFVETYPFQKLFEVYVIEEEQEASDRAALARELERLLPSLDVVIVADYGHGMIEREVVELLCDRAPFLAINTQKNAGNHGFNTVSKYRRAHFFSVSEGELRLDARTKRGALEDLVSALAHRLGARQAVVTRGGEGCLCYDADHGFIRVPALTSSVRDRVGAGDAVFAVTSTLSKMGVHPALLGLAGNAAGAQAVGTVGNRNALDRAALLKHLQHVLK